MSQENQITRVRPPTERVSGRSITALVLGVLFLCLGPLGIVPVVVGIIALARPRVGCVKQGKPHAIAGIVLGVIGLFGTLVWVGVYFKLVERVDFQLNQSSMRALAHSLMIYAESSDQRFPTQDEWPSVLFENGLFDQGMYQGSDRDRDGVSYIYIADQVYQDGDSILFYEDPKHWKHVVLVGFADGRIEEVPHDQFEELLSDQHREQTPSP